MKPGKRIKRAGLLKDGVCDSLDRLNNAFIGCLRSTFRNTFNRMKAVISFGLFASPHMKGQLNAVAQTLFIKNATNVTLYRPQAEL